MPLHAKLCVSRAKFGMFAELLFELREPARILVLELHAGRTVSIFLREDGYVVVVDEFRDDLGLGVEFLPLALFRAIPTAGHHQRKGTPRMAKSEMEGGE